MVKPRWSAASLAAGSAAILGGIAAVAALPILVYAEVSAGLRCLSNSHCVRSVWSPLEFILPWTWWFAAPVISTFVHFWVGFAGVSLGRRAFAGRFIDVASPAFIALVALLGVFLLYSGVLGLIAAGCFLVATVIIATTRPAAGSMTSSG